MGASEVVVVLNSNATNDPYYVEVLFADGPPPVTPGKPKELFPVFASPSAATVRQLFRGFHKSNLPVNSQFLKVFAVVTMVATTADNRYFGIAGGHNITIHVVNVCSD